MDVGGEGGLPPPSFKISTTIFRSCVPVSWGVVGEVPSSLTRADIISNKVMLQDNTAVIVAFSLGSRVTTPIEPKDSL